MTASTKSLKDQNIKWLSTVVGADAIVLIIIAFPGMLSPVTSSDYAWLRTLGVSIAPVVVLLISSLLSSNVKAVMVFWRLNEVLPGHRTFSVYAPNDPRIDIDALRKKAGTFPNDGKEQNAMWYRLFKAVWQGSSNLDTLMLINLSAKLDQRTILFISMVI